MQIHTKILQKIRGEFTKRLGIPPEKTENGLKVGKNGLMCIKYLHVKS